MANKLSQRTLVILRLCETPQRYTTLKAATNLSDAGLYKKLEMLVKKGWIRKLPDGSYVLTDAGRSALEEIDTLEIVREAMKRYGASAVKEAVTQIMSKRIEEAVTEVEIVETLVRVLRAWATITAFWLSSLEKREHPLQSIGDEERRALSIIETALRKIGGEQWYRKHSLLLYPHERELIEEHGGRAGVALPIIAFVLEGRREDVLSSVERELGAIRQERLSLLETPLRGAILTLLRLVDERKRELGAVAVPDGKKHILGKEETSKRGMMFDYHEEYRVAVVALSRWLYGIIMDPFRNTPSPWP